MKDEYDFSNAERGKFFREGARLVPPVHLDPEVLDYLTARASEANWYLIVFDPGQQVRDDDDVAALCARNEELARKLLVNAWSDPKFIAGYARWTIEILEQQRHYHHCIATRQHGLLHRVHLVNTWLFGLTAFGAMLHLAVHTIWLSVITTFFPALGASLHGALAQSEAYRLGTTSERLVARLGAVIDRVRANTDASAARGDVAPLRRNTRTGTCWCGRTA